MWLEILNKSFEETVEIRRRYEATNKKRHCKVYRKCTNRKKKRQHCSFLNRCNFAYVGRDTANQAAKVAPGVIKMATNDINNIAKESINQVISQGGKEMECVLPKILRGAIKDVYQVSFRLLGNSEKQKFNQI